MNIDDTDRPERTQVTLRLERDLLERIDELAAERNIERTELARRLLSDGIARERMGGAVAAYAAGRMSLWMAASQAGVNLYEIIDRVADADVPYRIDPEVVDRLRNTGGSGRPSSGGSARRGAVRASDGPETMEPVPNEAARLDDAASGIEGRRAAYRPDRVRLLLVGESSPAGETHFYLTNSNLYRATREGLARGLSVGGPPEGNAFLAWFRGLGCWLVDLADRPVNHLQSAERRRLVRAGIPRLTDTLREVEPERVVVVLSSIASAVRAAAAAAGYDERAIDVLPFPTRQWRPVYVEQLAGIVRGILGESHADASVRSAVAERPVEYKYGAGLLHDAIAEVLRRHPGEWTRSSAIAHEIAAADLWRRPSDGKHPPASQVSARVRRYPARFQTSDLGIRLRGD